MASTRIQADLKGINWYQVPLDILLKQPGGTLGRHLARKGRSVVIAAKGQAGVQTGALKASIKILTHDRAVYGQRMTIGSHVRHAYMHHQGTKPHVIIAKPGKMLRFSARGRIVYTRKAMHPGTKPNRYLADNIHLIL